MSKDARQKQRRIKRRQLKKSTTLKEVNNDQNSNPKANGFKDGKESPRET